MKMKLLMSAGLVMFLVASFAAAQGTTPTTGASQAGDAICEILYNITWLLNMIAAGVGTVVIVLQGVKWAGSAEDPGARKQAKQGIIHAVVGLVIVIIAIWVVEIVFTNARCDVGNWNL